MTQQEFQAIVRQCSHFLSGHIPRSVQQRMGDIAKSSYAEMAPDHYGNGGYVSDLEKELADTFGKEAAVFMPSGTMAQPIALRIWADRSGNNRVAFHPKCHLYCHEHMAYAELHHLQEVLLGEEDRLFTLSDLQQVQEDVGSLLIELPQRDLGGDLPSPSELAAIIAHAKAKGMKLHLDGARLWECQPFFGQSYEEIVRDFDSLYVSFYKILGGLPGAALVGPADFIDEARIWMRRHGGNFHLMAPNAISAKQGMDHHLPKIPDYVEKAQEIAAALQGLPGLTVLPSHPKVNMFHLKFEAGSEAIMEASAHVAMNTGCLLIRYVGSDGVAEITIGEAALDITSDMVRQSFELLLEHTRQN